VKGYPLIPGVIAPGHFRQGCWHPGDVADCPQCEPAPRPAPVLVEVKVEMFIPNQGSDCKTGKRQFATRKAAMGSYHSLQRRREGLAPRPYKCAWCLTWHVGNRRSNVSKGRTRR
jgi:hypothetical protein